MGGPVYDTNAMIELMDRQRITDVMLRFGRGLDLHDWDMYASTLADPFEVDFFDLTGPGALGHHASSVGPSSPREPATTGRDAPILEFPHRRARRRRGGVFYHVSRHRLPNRHGDDH